MNSIDTQPAFLSVSVVLFETPILDLETFLLSLVDSFNQLSESRELAGLQIFLINNSLQSKQDYQSKALQCTVSANLPITIEYITGHGNVGYGAGHNLAINRTRSKFHLIANADSKLSKYTLECGIDFMCSKPEIVISGPFATDSENKPQYLTKSYPSLWALFLRSFAPTIIKKRFKRKIHEYEVRNLPISSPTIGVKILSGCFMLCKSDALKQCGGFDESFFLYFEDFDLCIRMGKKGQLCFNPSMKIIHEGGQTAAKGAKHVIYFLKSMIHFFNKHGWKVT